jgi:hypothetical protein
VRQRLTTGQQTAIQKPECGRSHADPLAMIDRLLGEPIVADRAPANLDDHQGRGRSWIDRDKIKLEATDMDVSRQDGPTGRREPVGDQRFCRVTRLLGRRPCWLLVRSVGHARIVVIGTYPARIHSPDGSGRCTELQRLEIERVEHGVISHDRDELAGEERVGLSRRCRVRQQVELELIAGQRPLERQE